MLKSIKVYGLFHEYDYDVELSDKGMTFIHSQNGFGKSTLMKLVFNVLTGNLEDVAVTPFERLDLGFDGETFLFVENRGGDLLVQIQRNQVEEELSVDDLKSILKVTYIPPERMVVMKDDCMVPALKEYVEELTQSIKNAKSDCTLCEQPKEIMTDYTDDELEFWCKDIKAKLEFIKQAGFEPDMPSGYRFPPSRFEIMEYRQEYKDLAYEVDDYVKRHYCLAESIIVFMDVVNNVFINKTVFINESGTMIVKLDNGSSLSIDKLSSGEKHILVIFYRLLFQTDIGSLVIIDEPEMSLHITWQQQMGRFFADVARLRKLHLIVATHSPQIIHDDWDLAVELKVER